MLFMALFIILNSKTYCISNYLVILDVHFNPFIIFFSNVLSAMIKKEQPRKYIFISNKVSSIYLIFLYIF